MSQTDQKDPATDLKNVVQDILNDIPQDREREIISRRFGLYDRKETLESIGDMLGITRERVRQLEKAILTKLRQSLKDGGIPSVAVMEKTLTTNLSEMGRVARVNELAKRLLGREGNPSDNAHVAFITELVPTITAINENDDYYQSATISSVGDEKSVKKQVEEIV